VPQCSSSRGRPLTRRGGLGNASRGLLDDFEGLAKAFKANAVERFLSFVDALRWRRRESNPRTIPIECRNRAAAGVLSLQPARSRASGRQPGEARAIGAGHRPGHLEGAPTVDVHRYTAGTHDASAGAGTARSEGEGERRRGRAGDTRTLSVRSGFRAQGSKQGRVCCAAGILSSLDTSTPSQVTDSQDVAIDTFAPKCKHPGERENGGTDDLA
jgi:hypothetical protein